MYLQNLAPTHGFANGSMGTITAIYLDPREVVNPNAAYVQLKYHPVCIAVKPDRPSGKIPHIPGLPIGSCPVYTRSETFYLKNRAQDRIKINRKQFDLIPAYAFTNDKSQGQTINPVVVDLKKPSGRASREGFYVALSRGSGKDNIRILRPVQQDMLKLLAQGPSESIRKDDKILKEQHEKTKRLWEEGHLFW